MFHVEHPAICIKGTIIEQIEAACSTWNVRLLEPTSRSVGGVSTFPDNPPEGDCIGATLGA